MPWKKRVLVLANVTATSQELLEVMRSRAQSEPVEYTLIVPATHSEGGRAAARAQLGDALTQLQDAGLEVAGEVRDADPLIAVSRGLGSEALRRDRHLDTADEVFEVDARRAPRARVQAHRGARHTRRLRASAAGRELRRRPPRARTAASCWARCRCCDGARGNDLSA